MPGYVGDKKQILTRLRRIEGQVRGIGLNRSKRPHQQAIDAAKLVAGRTDRSQLVTLADTITTSQAAEIQTMEGWLQRWQRPRSATNQMAHEAEHVWGMMSEGELDWLARLDGREFELGFTTSMKTHHLGAIKMASASFKRVGRLRCGCWRARS